MPSPPTEPATPGCATCGGPIPPRAPFGQCPRCLIGLARSTVTPKPSERRIFGDYELLEEVARGGMGVVYRAIQTSLRREVALKLMIGGELSSARARRMFQTEALASAALHHPHIAAVYDSGEVDLQPYIAIRFIPGGTNIAQWAEPLRQARDWKRIALNAATVARAVAHAHERGVLHRDLKPSNILWEEPGGPQVTDFGLAKIIDASGDGATLTAEWLGSPGYMAPEQTGGSDDEITTATDVYGLGAVLYELFSGKPPFRGKSALDTARMVREHEPAPLVDVPADLATVCHKCLAKSPADRYPSAQAVAEDLERFSRGEPVHALPVGPLPRLWRWAKRKPALASLLALTVLTLAGGIAGVFWQWQQAESARILKTAALQKAEMAIVAQNEALEHLRWQEMDALLARGDPARALARAAAFIRERPEDWRAAMFAMSIVDTHAFPMMVTPPISAPKSHYSVPACLSPDGKWIVHPASGGIVNVFDSATGTAAASFRHAPRLDEVLKNALAGGETIVLDSSEITSMTVGAGPLPLALATGHPLLTVRPLPEGKPITLTVLPQPAKIRGLQHSADGRRLLGRSKSAVMVWNLDAPETDPWWASLPHDLEGAVLSADGNTVLAWSRSDLAVWTLTDSRQIVDCHSESPIVAATLSTDGTRAASVESSRQVRQWSAPAWTERRIPDASSALALAMNADGSRVLTGGQSIPLAICDTDSMLPISREMWTHKLLGVIGERGGWIVTSTDGNWHATTGLGETVCVWNATTGQPKCAPIRLGSGHRFSAMDISPDASLILTHRLIDQSELSLWKTTAVRHPKPLPTSNRPITACAISLDGQRSAVSLAPTDLSQKYSATVADLASGKEIVSVNADRPIQQIWLSGDGSRGHVLFKMENSFGIAAMTLTGDLGTPWNKEFPGLPSCFESSQDGKLLIAGASQSNGAHGLMVAFDATTGDVVGAFDVTGSAPSCARFAPNRSDILAVGTNAGTIALWNPREPVFPRTVVNLSAEIFDVAWSPDGRRLAVVEVNKIFILDVATAAVVAEFEHPSWLSGLEFSPDGRQIAAAGRDGTLLLLSAETGAPLHPPRRQGISCESVEFSRDGSTLLVLDTAGFRFWDTASFEPVTVHYPGKYGSETLETPMIGNLMTADGTGVLMQQDSHSAALFTVEKPAVRAPDWFPELLETLSLMKIHSNDSVSLVKGTNIFRIRERIAGEPEGNPYARWARRVLE